jgi:membrane-associated phospholipid phosphatase
VLSGYALLLHASRHPNRWIASARDWLPLPLMPLAYRQMGWFAPANHSHTLEQSWIGWDRMLFDWGFGRAIESLGLLLPALLEASYLTVYAVPTFSMAYLALTGRGGRMNHFLTVFLASIYLAYAQFPFWPSEPPRTLYPGLDAPTLDTIFRRLNGHFLGVHGIHTSVFPSAHVSSVFAAAIGMRRAAPENPSIYRGLFLYATAVALATVYGRYHYAVDALAGGCVAWAAAALTGRIWPCSTTRPR